MVTSGIFDELRGSANGDKERYAAENRIPNGSTFYEIDGAHRVFMWDAEAKTWVEQ